MKFLIIITTCKQYYSKNIPLIINSIVEFNIPRKNIIIVSSQEVNNSITYKLGIKIVKVKYTAMHLTGLIYIYENLSDYKNINYFLFLPCSIEIKSRFYRLLSEYLNVIKNENIEYTPLINYRIRPTMDIGIMTPKHILRIKNYLKKIKLEFPFSLKQLLNLKRKLIFNENIIFLIQPGFKESFHISKLNSNLQKNKFLFIINTKDELNEKIIYNYKENLIYNVVFLSKIDIYKYQCNFNETTSYPFVDNTLVLDYKNKKTDDLKIEFGTSIFKIDVTSKCYQIMKNNIIFLPNNQLSTIVFGDPSPGINKKYFITYNNITKEYNDNLNLKINIIKFTIESIPKYIIEKDYTTLPLKLLHNNLKPKNKILKKDLIIQEILVKYIKGNEKVLEITSDISKNSLIVAYILNKLNNNDFVIIDKNKNVCDFLNNYKIVNNLSFYIENSVLQKINLNKKIITTNIKDKINYISFNQLVNKYSIIFNTLIINCTKTLQHILNDFPEILNDINLIIIKYNYSNNNQIKFIEDFFNNSNFKKTYSKDWYNTDNQILYNYINVWIK